MYFTPTIFIARLLATMQVLMTLDIPLSTTLALPVTSKPIESTVENLAWQAWIALPPEQKQQVKSRKVTPKSIFTLPLRVECPEGHKQVDTKCIPIVIGSNDVLIDLNALGLLVGNTQPEDLYDYDDMGEEIPLPFAGEMPIGEADKSGDGLTVELRPPSKDEPLKFNIFQNEFPIFHEEPLEDYYSSISNEGLHSSEKEQNLTVSTQRSSDDSSNANVTTLNDLVRESSNSSKDNLDFYVQHKENYSSSGSEAEESKAFTTLSNDGEDFKIDAISVPVVGLEITKQNKLSLIQNDSSIQLVTSPIDREDTITTDDRDKQPENDIQMLLQTESFLPLLNHTTAMTMLNCVVKESFSLTAVPLREPIASSPDNLSLDIDEEITTLPNAVERDMKVKTKQEYTRSVTINPMISEHSGSGDIDDSDDNDHKIDSTLEIVTNDNLLETTTPIQLDETTIIETHSSLSTSLSAQQELKEWLLQEEQVQKDFEELQRMRKGQKDQHVVLKKSKVQPVEMLSTTTEATTKTTASATNAANSTAATKLVDELITTAAATVTPLFTAHDENDNNDRFYYQHFAKQENEIPLSSGSESKQKIATASAPLAVTGITEATTTEIAKIPLTSEIDLAEELRLINELVKGIQPATTLTATTKTTTIKTTEKPTTSTTKTIFTDDFPSTSYPSSFSESLSVAKKSTLSASEIWSKIMPLLTTSSTTPMPKISALASLNGSNQTAVNDTQIAESISSSSMRSNRNSKIIRINGFNSIIAAKTKQSDITTPIATTTTAIFEDPTPTSYAASSSSPSSTSENNTYEPYWWLPVAWRLDKPTSSEKQQEEQEVKSEEQSLLLRFWSAYAPRSS